MEETFGTISLSCDSTPKHDSDKIDYGGVMASDATGETPPSEDASLSDAHDTGMEMQMEPGDHSAEPDEDADALALRIRPAPGRPGGPVKVGTEEAFYLLATYCFDLQRKMEYLYKATRAFAPFGDPVIARQLLADERHINAPGLTWKQRALRAEARMLDLQREIGLEHRRLLEQVANSDRPRDAEPGAP
ncbi:MAG: hypothetical protein ACXW61_12510 [Gemmatirosa sp.]